MSDTSKSKAIDRNLADAKAVGDAAKQAASQARDAGAQALDQAKDVAQDAKSRASSLAGDVKQQALSTAESGKDTLADKIDQVAQSVHRTGEKLEGEQDWIAHLVERGADELTSLADTLRTNDLQSLLSDLGGLAKRQPALFVGASIVAGFALARVGKVAATGSTTDTSAGQGASTSMGASASAGHASPSASTPASTAKPATSPATALPAPAIISGVGNERT